VNPSGRELPWIALVAAYSRRGRTTPEGHEPYGGRCQPLLQVVADYNRLNAVLATRHAGRRRASGRQYPGMRDVVLCDRGYSGVAGGVGAAAVIGPGSRLFGWSG
jgi:hypothetical protein